MLSLAKQIQSALTSSQITLTQCVLEITVVASNVAAPDEPNPLELEDHVRALAVPLSLNRNFMTCPVTGVPVGALMVKAAASAVTV